MIRFLASLTFGLGIWWRWFSGGEKVITCGVFGGHVVVMFVVWLVVLWWRGCLCSCGR